MGPFWGLVAFDWLRVKDRYGVIRDQAEPATIPVTSAMPPKAEQIRRQPCSLRGPQRSAMSQSRIARRLGEPPLSADLLAWGSSHRSPGHHVDGGSLAEILRCRRATKWDRVRRTPQ